MGEGGGTGLGQRRGEMHNKGEGVHPRYAYNPLSLAPRCACAAHCKQNTSHVIAAAESSTI